mgnify:FL=1
MPKKLPALFGFAFLFFYGLVASDVSPDIYQARDLDRAAGLLNGHFIWYGPELSGGGHLPGPFYYWLLAIPLALGRSWASALTFNCMLSAAAATALFDVFERRVSSFAGLLAYVLFLNSIVIVATAHAFWNPSFLFLFQVLIVAALWSDQALSRFRLAAARPAPRWPRMR